VVMCLEQGANELHMVQLTQLPPLPLASLKFRMVLPFWYQLTQVVLEKSPLNGCLSAFKIKQTQLSGQRLDVYHTSIRDMALVRI